MKTPCMNCPDRTLGCHSTCKAYKKYTEERNKEQEMVRKANDTSSFKPKKRVQYHSADSIHRHAVSR